jgi:MFS transporter, PAT family, beta-lactamase induction signal transducer AmpG
MKNLKNSQLLSYGLIYFVQGAAFAYLNNFQKPYLNAVGVDSKSIALLSSFLLLPFILKIFIGVISDRINFFGQGYRLPYIVIGLIGAAVAFGSVYFVTPNSNFQLFMLISFFASLSIAIYDTTTDGVAIDNTPEHKYGLVQGVMMGSRALGLVLLSLIFGQIASRYGYQHMFTVLAVITFLAIPVLLLFGRPAQEDKVQRFEWQAFKAIKQAHVWLFILYVLIVAFASHGITGLVTFHMSRTFGATEAAVGNYGALRGIGAVMGAIIGGMLLDRLDRRTAAFLGMAGISLGGMLIAVAPNLTVIIGLGLLWGMASGFQDTTYISMAMNLADKRIAASMFALLVAFANVGIALAEGLGTSLTASIGFVPVFLMFAAVNLFLAPLIWGMFRKRAQLGTNAALVETPD